MKEIYTAVSNMGHMNRYARMGNLMQYFSAEWLEEAHKELKGNKKKAGIDNIQRADYKAGRGIQPRELAVLIENRLYKPMPYSRVYIPKANGKLRGLNIPCYVDKIVQYVIAEVLKGIFEPTFPRNIHGYRTNKGTQSAVKDLYQTLKQDWAKWVLVSDIKGFFDEMNHDWVRKFLEERISDSDFIDMTMNMLKAGTIESNSCGAKSSPMNKGAGQGAVCSPIIANIYIYKVLMQWADLYGNKVNGKWKIINYADDFVAIFEDEDEAKKFLTAVNKRFKAYDLQLNMSKTQIVEAKEDIHFLGFKYKKSNNGVDIETKTKSLKNAIEKIELWFNNLDGLDDVEWFRLYNMVNGHYQYFGVKGNKKQLDIFYMNVEKSLKNYCKRKGVDYNAIKKEAVKRRIKPPKSKPYWNID